MYGSQNQLVFKRAAQTEGEGVASLHLTGNFHSFWHPQTHRELGIGHLGSSGIASQVGPNLNKKETEETSISEDQAVILIPSASWSVHGASPAG